VICRNPLKKTRTDVSARTRKGIDRATYSRIRDLCDHTAASNVQSYWPTYRKSIPMSYFLCCLLKATRSHHGLSTRVSVDYGDQQMTDFAYLKQCYGLSQIIATNLCSVSPTSTPPTTTLADIIPLLKNAFFTIQVIYTPITQSFESDLHDIAVQNHREKHLLRTAPITSLMILQMHALKSNLKPAKALKARALIAKTLRVNHTRYVHAYPTFRIPCSTIENSEIRELIYHMVCSVMLTMMRNSSTYY
jgi:hypothetical protein